VCRRLLKVGRGLRVPEDGPQARPQGAWRPEAALEMVEKVFTGPTSPLGWWSYEGTWSSSATSCTDNRRTGNAGSEAAATPALLATVSPPSPLTQSPWRLLVPHALPLVPPEPGPWHPWRGCGLRWIGTQSLEAPLSEHDHQGVALGTAPGIDGELVLEALAAAVLLAGAAMSAGAGVGPNRRISNVAGPRVVVSTMNGVLPAMRCFRE
jgi:hypothetical protein